MPDSKEISALRREINELERTRSWYAGNGSWSSESRRRAVETIDGEIAAKKAEVQQLEQARPEQG